MKSILFSVKALREARYLDQPAHALGIGRRESDQSQPRLMTLPSVLIASPRRSSGSGAVADHEAGRRRLAPPRRPDADLRHPSGPRSPRGRGIAVDREPRRSDTDRAGSRQKVGSNERLEVAPGVSTKPGSRSGEAHCHGEAHRRPALGDESGGGTASTARDGGTPAPTSWPCCRAAASPSAPRGRAAAPS